VQGHDRGGLGLPRIQTVWWLSPLPPPILCWKPLYEKESIFPQIQACEPPHDSRCRLESPAGPRRLVFRRSIRIPGSMQPPGGAKSANVRFYIRRLAFV